MAIFNIVVQRTQVKTLRFNCEAESLDRLKARLGVIKFSSIDELFDRGEVDSIDYDVTSASDFQGTLDDAMMQTVNDEALQWLLDCEARKLF